MTNDQLLDDRYGRRRRPRWHFLIVVTALLTIAIAWSLWAALDHSGKPISGQLFGYEVVDAHRTDVTIEVYRVASGPAVCTVDAQALDHAIVGEREVEVPASDQETTHIKATIKTERLAVTAELKGCVLAP